jgi:hypothetical protein
VYLPACAELYVHLNEIGAGNISYVELAGAPNAPLAGLSYVAVRGGDPTMPGAKGLIGSVLQVSSAECAILFVRHCSVALVRVLHLFNW